MNTQKQDLNYFDFIGHMGEGISSKEDNSDEITFEEALSMAKELAALWGCDVESRITGNPSETIHFVSPTGENFI